MKHMKKMMALVVAAAMMLAMSMTVFAEDSNNGSIIINSAVKDQTYTIYEILKLENYDSASGAYAYKATDAWSGFINGNGIKDVYVDVDSQGYVTWKKKDNQGNEIGAADFAKAAQKYAADSKIGNQGSQVASSDTVTFNSLELGYYLLDSSLGTLCSLDTTNPSVTIQEKNVAPSNEKTVEEDSTSSYGSVNDADIGQTVNFKSKITIPKGSENIVFHDEMSNSLTLDTSSIKVYTDENMTTVLSDSNYTTTSTGLTDGCTFEISFDQTFLDGLTADSTIVYVGYSATVNERAVVGGSGNTNKSKVKYGEKGETTTSTTTTYTWSFDVLKYANGDKTKVLADAQFVLLNSDKSQVAVIVNGKLQSWSNVSDVETDGTINWSANMTLTTGQNGKIAIAGLDADTYYLREIKAPDGYNKLSDDVKVEIKPTTDNAGSSMTLTAVTAEIENKSGSALPSTGGIGTTVFYVIGGILVIIAGVLLVVKRRMKAEK